MQCDLTKLLSLENSQIITVRTDQTRQLSGNSSDITQCLYRGSINDTFL